MLIADECNNFQHIKYYDIDWKSRDQKYKDYDVFLQPLSKAQHTEEHRGLQTLTAASLNYIILI